MKFNLPVTLLVAALGLGTPAFMMSSFAGDKQPTTRPAKAVKLIKPYNAISTLTDEQKQKISEIHAAALAEIKKIQAKEAEDILAQLSDDQKKELEKIQEAEAAARKAKEGAPKGGGAKEDAGKEGSPK